MEGFIVFIFIGTLFPLFLTIEQLRKPMEFSRLRAIIINLIIWCYEIFFLMAVCNFFPSATVSFGGGLGDLFFLLILIILTIGHIITISIMSRKTTKAALFYIPIVIVAIPLISLHQTAARGNESNGYMVAGNNAGLYYNHSSKYDKYNLQNDTEDVLMPKDIDFNKKIKEVLYLANKGNSWAMNSIGCRYANGLEIEKNDTLAVKWFRMSAENGNYLGEYNLGVSYYKGIGGLSVNYVEAVKWFERSARELYPNAQYMLGSCYLNAIGVEKNLEEGFMWLTMAASTGHIRAKELLAKYNYTY